MTMYSLRRADALVYGSSDVPVMLTSACLPTTQVAVCLSLRLSACVCVCVCVDDTQVGAERAHRDPPSSECGRVWKVCLSACLCVCLSVEHNHKPCRTAEVFKTSFSVCTVGCMLYAQGIRSGPDGLAEEEVLGVISPIVLWSVAGIAGWVNVRLCLNLTFVFVIILWCIFT